MRKKSKKRILVYVATAGIGRMGFGSWLGGEKIDRSDGDDEGTFSSISDALEDAGLRIERMLLANAWSGKKTSFGDVAATTKKQLSDVEVVELTCEVFDGEPRFEARLLDDEEGESAPFVGPSPSTALGLLGCHIEREAAHWAWVMRRREIDVST